MWCTAGADESDTSDSLSYGRMDMAWIWLYFSFHEDINVNMKTSPPFQNPGVNLHYGHNRLQHRTGGAGKHFQNFSVHHHLIDYRLEVAQGVHHFFLLLFQPAEILKPEKVEVDYRSAKESQKIKNKK